MAYRVPDEVRSRRNRLANASSAYLRQHATNPLDWQAWTAEALQQARTQDKPVFLSIGYASCHWCHVMEREVFCREDVAAALNRDFVCIKVDREERPDLDEIYMQALLLMHGSGGWPLNMFLTPQLEPIFGATYIPREQFITLAQRIAELYRTERGELLSAARTLSSYLEAAHRPESGAVGVPEALAVSRLAGAELDRQWGGFTSAHKFPVPTRQQFLLHCLAHEPAPEMEELLRLSLDRMADGGLQDQLAGGFHRYCVDAEWRVPHFEKMLYDNAQLAQLYLAAHLHLGEARYLATAETTLDFMLATLQVEGGAFAASLDADSDGEEGRYYLWDAAELTAVAGPQDGPALAALFGIAAPGDIEGRSVLTRRADPATVALAQQRPLSDIAALPARWREPLLAARALRTPPALDVKVVTAWNGMAISALAQAALVTGQERYRAAAEAATDYLWRMHHAADGSLARASTGGMVAAPGVLDDYAWLAVGLIDLYSATACLRYLAQAVELVEYVEAEFSDGQGGFYLARADSALPMGRRAVCLDSAEPSGQAVLAHAQLRLGALTGQPGYTTSAREMLAGHASRMQRFGMEMAWWWDAVLLAAAPFTSLVIAGSPAEPASRAFAHLALKELGLTVGWAAEEQELAAAGLAAPALSDKSRVDDAAAAYLCTANACLPPVTSAEELEEQLTSGLRQAVG